MDYDIHYYGTYAASRIAGWSADDAKAIAEAALFVDYCDYNEFGYTYVLDKQVLGVPVITSQFLATFSYKDANDPSIWVPFHFLPGNFKGKNYSSKHMLRQTDSEMGAFLCRPYSPFVNKMVEDTVASYDKLKSKHKMTALNLVGLRMHIFADTWAHQDFCGFDDEETNNCGDKVHMYDEKKKTLGINFSKRTYDLKAAPPKSNMGHGRLGHLPDMGWLNYTYEPQWAKNTKGWQSLFRNNPAEFEEAFEEMIAFLYKIRTGRSLKAKKIDSSKMSLSQEKLIVSQTAKSSLEYPSSFTDIMSKERVFGSAQTGVFPQAANDWCEKLMELGLLKTDDLRHMNVKTRTYDKDWESNFAKKYMKDFEVLGSANVTQPWKRKAKLKEESNFLAFQEAAALHMNFFTKTILQENNLCIGTGRIFGAWTYSNSYGFRCYAQKKYNL